MNHWLHSLRSDKTATYQDIQLLETHLINIGTATDIQDYCRAHQIDCKNLTPEYAVLFGIPPQSDALQFKIPCKNVSYYGILNETFSSFYATPKN